MKRIYLIAIAVITLVFSSCIKDDDTPIILETGNTYNNYYGENPSNPNNSGESCPTISLTGAITEDETWTSDNIYILNQKVVVESGVTLTINPGTIIKGSPGTGSLASALIIARDATIIAAGTATEPIIFTATSDNINCGENAGTNLDENDRGLWGGILILGNAPCSFSGDVTELQIEGIPADDTFGLYGGTNPDDNSGVLQYVSIRHGGALIGEGNEINGLTLGGVGAGTVIDNVEVVANVDDGIEFFGGTVNASNLLVYAQGDDGLDIDQAYSGTIDNAVVALGDVSDHALEIDGPEGTSSGAFTLQNVTLIGNETTTDGEYADYRKAATGSTSNVYAYGFKTSSDVELDNNAVAQEYIDGNLTFSNWQLVLPTGITLGDVFLEKNGEGESDISMFEADATTFATSVTVGTQTTGADTSNLSWTYSNQIGGFGF